MLRKLSVLLIALTFLPAILFAQERTFMRPDGKFYKSNKVPSSWEIMKMKHAPVNTNNQVIQFNKGPMSVNGLIDTLRYSAADPGSDPNFNTNFGLFGQDRMIQWFQASADLTIKAFGFNSTDDAGVINGAILEGKIVGVNLTYDELVAVPVERDGYYEAIGNGYNDITPFLGEPDNTGGWFSITGDPEPFGNDIWSDGGFGAPITPDPAGGTTYQWIPTNLLFEPDILGGDIFGIVYKNTGATMDVDRLGFLSGIVGFPGWKYYANGRLDPGVDFGWWSREYTWDFVVEVDVTGDPPPDINSFTTIPSGTDLGPFTVDADISDTNPGDPTMAGVADASIFWSIDGGTTWNEVAMTGTEPNYTGEIPVQSALTTVDYYIQATDILGHTSISGTVSFYIFAPSGAATLVVFNGYTSVTGYPQDYYFGEDIQTMASYFEHDTWAYGPLTTDIVNNYTYIIEICAGAPADYNDLVIGPWLDVAGHYYFLSGQEWLGDRYGYADMDFGAGTFEFDYLGISHSYNDISYDGVSGQAIPTLVLPEVSEFGTPLENERIAAGADSLMFNPSFEIPADNWQDAYDVADGVVDMMVETRGIGGAPDVQILPTMHHRTLSNGNMVVYAAFESIALNTAIDGSYPYYSWVGYTNATPPYHALEFFSVPILVDVQQVGNTIPEEFSISQNYPNPFNPSTTIKFSVPQASKVVLKVYDVLGKEVATLLNGDRAAGNYEVNFDASNLASGLYIYTINAGSFTATKKMMLMK
jgi:hypothetical protein